MMWGDGLMLRARFLLLRCLEISRSTQDVLLSRFDMGILSAGRCTQMFFFNLGTAFSRLFVLWHPDHQTKVLL